MSERIMQMKVFSANFSLVNEELSLEINSESVLEQEFYVDLINNFKAGQFHVEFNKNHHCCGTLSDESVPDTASQQ
jgi:hypothetical protein